MMPRVLPFLIVSALFACAAEPVAPAALAEQTTEAGEAAVATQLCTITRGEHVPAASGGNAATSSSNGVTISVMGSRSQSISSRNGAAEVTVTGAATLHLTFPGDEKATVQVSQDADLVRVSINGLEDISCETVA